MVSIYILLLFFDRLICNIVFSLCIFKISILLTISRGRKKYEHDYSSDGVSTNLGTDAAQFSCNIVPDESSKPAILKDDKYIGVSVCVESLKDDIYIYIYIYIYCW
ncbi:hypothetical protein AABB24_021508 [Solanum stoloniferum]|uniref:Uncharacterized protein n=1 Tax=Solanum stoloniferum TaxID=62892 RepID=A0ABD2SVM4_9SOLN